MWAAGCMRGPWEHGAGLGDRQHVKPTHACVPLVACKTCTLGPPSKPTQLLPHSHTHTQIQDYWKPLKNLERAQEVWTYWFDHAKAGCMHGPSCARRADGKECHWGGRQADVQMISGAVLPLWKVGAAEARKGIGGVSGAGAEQGCGGCRVLESWVLRPS